MTQHGFDDEDEDDIPEWVDQVMATVANEVRRRRKELGMSAQSLADACEEIGHPIPRNVIANMESGRRASLPLVDVMVLAEALHTNPICLIYPVGYVEEVQKLPLRPSEQTWNAMRWFTGTEPGELLTQDLMLRLFHQHESEQRALHAAESNEQDEAWKAKSANDATQREEALSAQAFYAERAALAKQRLRRIRAAIREEGGTPPMLLPSRFTDPFDDNNHPEEDF
ncbi:helix-turn-helix domain-containing protein [Streptomyces sp. NPDC058572]|uniref:helix-turn-helix domain-containing protein n=1 Tax=Streptomyces sp. NPDC058572 TaxID=3346546 RepID=UPI0036661015